MSVVIPTYNCASYVPEAVESALAQTYRPVELIVVDDGSQDDTKAVLARYGERIVVVAQPNLGVSAARNNGVRRARGELVAFLDSDDAWLPEKLDLQVAAMAGHPEAGWAFTDGIGVDEAGAVQSSLLPEGHTAFAAWLASHPGGPRGTREGWLYEALLFGNCVQTSTVLVRRRALDAIGGFDGRAQRDGKYVFAEDYDLWLRLARRYPVAFLPVATVRKRVREGSLSGSPDVRLATCRAVSARVLEEYLPSVPAGLARAVRSRLVEKCMGGGWNYFQLGRFREARAMFLRALRHDPFQPRALAYLVACTCFPPSAVGRLRRLRRRLRGLRPAGRA